MTRNIDLVVLAHARTFGLTVHPGQTKSTSSTTMRGGQVSDVEQFAAGERLEARGYLRRCGEDRTWGDGTVSRRYEVTDEGRAYVRAQDGLDDLTIDAARAMHARDLQEIWGGHPVADSQLALRAAGDARVRGALVACGEAHSGTGGWHVIPYVVAPEGRIGWVDTAKGRAYLSDVTLDAEMVVALTAPGQGAGPKASGAAVWSSPDAGGGTSTEAPDGWIQLVVDIRTHGDVDTIEASAELVAYGLVTCYSHSRGRPLSERVSSWPLDDDQRRRIESLAATWLDDLLERVGPDPGHARLEGAADEAAHCLYPFAKPAESGTPRRALCDYRIGWVADAAGEYTLDSVVGMRRIDAIDRALKRWAVERLAPLVEALPAELDAYTTDGQSRGTHDRRMRIVRAASAELLDLRMRELVSTRTAGHTRVHDLEDQLRAILYERGAIVTEEGRGAGVTCTSSPPRPQAVRGEIDGVEVWRVPFGAEAPEGFTHPLMLTVGHELRCRPEDAEQLTTAMLRSRS